MQADIHPTYYTKSEIKCACGATFNFGSSIESMDIDICSKCHPFYTGKEKTIMDNTVEKFKNRIKKHEAVKGTVKSKKDKRTARSAQKIQSNKQVEASIKEQLQKQADELKLKETSASGEKKAVKTENKTENS